MGITFLLSLGNTLTLRKQALGKDLGELWSIVRSVAANFPERTNSDMMERLLAVSQPPRVLMLAQLLMQPLH